MCRHRVNLRLLKLLYISLWENVTTGSPDLVQIPVFGLSSKCSFFSCQAPARRLTFVFVWVYNFKKSREKFISVLFGSENQPSIFFCIFFKISLQVCMTKPLPVTSHWMRTPKTTRLGQSPRSSQLNQQKSGSTFPLTWAHTQMAIFIFSTK